MLAVSAQACVEEPRLVFQAATGDSNPNNMERIIGLVGLDKRKHFEEGNGRQDFQSGRRAHGAASGHDVEIREDVGADVQRRGEESIVVLDRVRPRWGGGRVGEVIDLVKSNVERRRADA